VPFPLAHPAAVLPLRRFSPRWVDFPALVIGSIVPDSGYLLSRWGLENVAHSFWGPLIYAVPAGLLVLVLCRRTLALAGRASTSLSAASQLMESGSALWVTLLSLWISATAHVGWDTITHKNGWLVEIWPALRAPLLPFMGRTLKLQHVL
jgi:hypothetical protein